MKYYENNNIQWTKRHGIRIPYVNNLGINTYYVPDFLIAKNGVKSIEEIKGWIKDRDKIKAVIAIEYCKKLRLSYRFILGKEFKIIKELSWIENMD